MSEPICTVDSEFIGHCSACDGAEVHGYMIDGEFPTIDGKNICVTGSVGQGTCGHTCTAVGQSQVFRINGKQVARVGDPVTGTIVGTLVTGSWATSD